ncbi:hypothetical protein HPP92_005363 [Vanilla planifolia]|uniref:Uncharacterized protein n=1 Tax=Vanilla planifolia TaxID=51239 RepID=A0A835RS13_VANPL|nr:hypothetical protein HPP92_005363 [Vanilla planifolia]
MQGENPRDVRCSTDVKADDRQGVKPCYPPDPQPPVLQRPWSMFPFFRRCDAESPPAHPSPAPPPHRGVGILARPELAPVQFLLLQPFLHPLQAYFPIPGRRPESFSPHRTGCRLSGPRPGGLMVQRRIPAPVMAAAPSPLLSPPSLLAVPIPPPPGVVAMTTSDILERGQRGGKGGFNRRQVVHRGASGSPPLSGDHCWPVWVSGVAAPVGELRRLIFIPINHNHTEPFICRDRPTMP